MRIGKIGRLQLEILNVLWDHPGSTVQQVREQIDSNRPLAYTTIATMLKKMEQRGLVSHEKEGRQFSYTAKVSRESLSNGFMSDAMNMLFSGSLPKLVNQLLSRETVSKQELDELERLIEEKRKEL